MHMKTNYKISTEISYINRIKSLKVIPSISKQYKIYLETLEESTDPNKKRAFAALVECEKLYNDTAKNIIKYVADRYEIDKERFYSPYYFAQGIDNYLRGKIHSTSDANLRNCIAKYFRATIIAKQGGEILYKYSETTQAETTQAETTQAETTQAETTQAENASK